MKSLQKSLCLSAAILVGTFASASAEDIKKLRVGYIPVGIYSYLWRAQDAGHFKDAGIEVELVPMAGGGEIIPALQAGSLDLGISDAMGLLNARNAGIPAVYVSFNHGQTSNNYTHAIVTFDENIKSAADLAGKSVATNLSYNTDWAMMRAWLRNGGVDVESVQFREIPFPEMLGAVRSKSVDAVGMTEPFVTVAKLEGATVLEPFFAEVRSPNVFNGVLALEPWLEENPEIAAAFKEAIDKALTEFVNDPEIARKTIGEHTKIPAEVVATMNLGVWDPQYEVEPELKFWLETAKAEGLIDDDIDTSGLIWTQAK